MPLSLGEMLVRLGLFVGAAAFSFVVIGEVFSRTGSELWAVLTGVGIGTGSIVIGGRYQSSRAIALGVFLGAALPALALMVATVVGVVS